MAKNDPLSYAEFRNLDRSQQNPSFKECDGMCERCPRQRNCIVSRTEKIFTSGYRNSGDSEFNSRMLNVLGYSSRYSHRGDNSGFSNPGREYPTNGKDYSSRGDYSGSSSSGFRGSYDGQDGYSSMTPKGGKSNYCSSSGCGKK